MGIWRVARHAPGRPDSPLFFIFSHVYAFPVTFERKPNGIMETGARASLEIATNLSCPRWQMILADLRYRLQGVWRGAEPVDPRGNNNNRLATYQAWFPTPFACNARQTYVPALCSYFESWIDCLCVTNILAIKLQHSHPQQQMQLHHVPATQSRKRIILNREEPNPFQHQHFPPSTAAAAAAAAAGAATAAATGQKRGKAGGAEVRAASKDQDMQFRASCGFHGVPL
eukprot:1143620-Pelagomonas_calceolata.AAC.1